VLAADIDSIADPQACNAPTAAQAEQGCVCMLPITAPPPTGVVLLDKIKGDVLKAMPAGFVPVSKPTWLTVGDSVLVKSASTATLVAGASCQAKIGPDVSVVINPVSDTCACAMVAGEQHAAVADPGSKHGLLLALGVGAGAVLIIKHFIPPLSD
jgi:hypothetical protein